MRCGETGERLATGPGDIVEIPRGAVHAEGETTAPMTYLVAAPTTRALRDYLKMQDGPVT
jgi:quercetin dioxygenase-like cupin family protein